MNFFFVVILPGLVGIQFGYMLHSIMTGNALFAGIYGAIFVYLAGYMALMTVELTIDKRNKPEAKRGSMHKAKE